MHSKDYFIKDTVINAYTINAFAEAISEATKRGLAIDFDSARRISTSFSVNIIDNSVGEVKVETQETPADQTKSVEAQSTDADGEESEEQSDEPSEQSEEERLMELANQPQPFTLEDIEQAKGSMEELKKLAEPVGISGRSKKDVAEQLRKYIGA